MSNHVGELYNSVVETVLKEVRTAFEESGDDPVLLHMLKTSWKKRLQEMNVTANPLWPETRVDNTNYDNVSGSIHGMAPESYGNGVKMPGQDGMPTTTSEADQLLFNMHKSRFNESNNLHHIGNIGNIPPLSSDGRPQDPSNQPFDMLSGNNSGTTNSSHTMPSLNGIDEKINVGNADQHRSNLAFNPLDSSKPIGGVKQDNSNFSISPELQSQIQNAMNNDNKGHDGYSQVPQHDGAQDDELNSDLDDSEDELNSNEEEEDNEQTQLILCLYEKVHKVKTRWKYTLKDGVANINGLDYVFTRATGESEW